MKYFTDRFWSRIWADIWKNCKEITVDGGVLRFNYKCHINAFHHAINENHDVVIACFYQMKDMERPGIHFINFDGERYIDNTIGYLAESTRYYIIREINREEFTKETPWDFLYSLKKYYQQKATVLEKLFGDLSL